MRRSTKEYVSTSVTTVFLLVTLAVTPAAADIMTPVVQVTTPVPQISTVYLNHGERPDALSPTVTAAPTPVAHTVLQGETLYGIAGSTLSNPARWTDLWNANRPMVPNPNLIHPGLVLTVPAGHVDPPAGAVSVISAPVHARTPLLPAPVHRHAAPPVQAASSAPTGGSGLGTLPPIFSTIEKCESGGNPHAQNPHSSASGLFQEIDSTWHAYGGTTTRAADASVAEQIAVTEHLYAADGLSPWNASRGCWG